MKCNKVKIYREGLEMKCHTLANVTLKSEALEPTILKIEVPQKLVWMQ